MDDFTCDLLLQHIHLRLWGVCHKLWKNCENKQQWEGQCIASLSWNCLFFINSDYSTFSEHEKNYQIDKVSPYSHKSNLDKLMKNVC